MSRFGAAIFGCAGTDLTDAEREFFKEFRPFGFILFARNLEDPDQIRKMCDDLRAAVDHEAPILIDQEGGRVQRLRPPMATEWPAPLDHADQFGPNAARGMYLRYRLIAEELRSLGIDSNCAPVLDVVQAETHPFLKNRCYGRDAKSVAEMGRAVANGLMDGGVLPVMKHMPGHGRATVDSHFDVPNVSAAADLEEDFAPFRVLKDLPMGMTGHIRFEAFDTAPATTSEIVVRLIREEIGFDGLLMTDDISMQALQGSVKTRSLAALQAGCDVVLHCNGKLDEMIEIADLAQNMTVRTEQRAGRVLDARRVPDAVDIAALSAELEALAAG